MESESFVYKTLDVAVDSQSESTEFTEECTLTGLKKQTQYAITVQAFNSKGKDSLIWLLFKILILFLNF